MTVFAEANKPAEIKPHRGRISGARKHDTLAGSYYTGMFLDHPRFAGRTGHTSLVVKDDCDIPRHRNDSYEIETLNSRYTIIPLERDEVVRRSC